MAAKSRAKSARPAPKKKAAARKSRPAAKPAPVRRAVPLLPPAPEEFRAPRPPPKFELGVDPKKIDEAIKAIRAQVTRLMQRGFADKIRIKYKGKPLGPDIPVAYFLAAEAFAFWTTGILRVLLVNLGARALLEIELISSAVEQHAKGVERYLAGDLEAAVTAFERAVASDDYHAPSHRMLGTILRIRGKTVDAKRHLERAVALDPDGEEGTKARTLLEEMG